MDYTRRGEEAVETDGAQEMSIRADHNHPTTNSSVASHNIGQERVPTMQAFQGSRILHLGAMNIDTMGDEVLAISAETGAALWSYKLPGNLVKQSGFLGTAPPLAGDSIVVATLSSELMELDIETDKTRASYEVGAPVRAQPAVVAGWIYVGTQDGRLVAINTGKRALTGWPMWGGDAARTGGRTLAKGAPSARK